MSQIFHIVVCAGIAPDPLQSLEPVLSGGAPALKNEMMLPAVLDPWAAHALYEADHLAKSLPGSKVWLVSMSPRPKLQQVLMTLAQKVSFELVAIDGPSSGFADSMQVAGALTEAIEGIAGLDRGRMLLFGGWESATRAAGVTLTMVGERLGITEQFQAVDVLRVSDEGMLEIHERAEGGRHQVSLCGGPPALLGWATGNLPEPPNNPQTGMLNMRTMMPALQRAKAAPLQPSVRYLSASLPSQQRSTRVVKDATADEVAQELATWIRGN
jgi:electron transfer flavoprotein beta subunit